MRLLLGVGAGIAAYKCADLVRRARERGAQVQVVATESALHFVGAATFQALSGRPVRSSLWDEAAEAAMGHIELARWATQILVAPATADLIARLRAGSADDLLTTVCLASAAPLAIAPAMNAQMWAHPALQDNLACLVRRGVCVLGPAHGSQACGDVGAGRMLEPLELLEALALPTSTLLQGRRVVVSAGPTFEDLDPVRFLGNRSSGKMGFAIAAAARAAGAEVQLIAGPVHLATPAGCQRTNVRSALQMREAVLAAAAAADIYVGAAAVADYRPASAAEHKIKKGADSMTLSLVRNPDIIAELGAGVRPRLLVGFAAETRDVIAYAQAKRAAKGLDLIVANRVGPDAAFDREDNALTVISADAVIELGSGTKRQLAARLVELMAARLPQVAA